MVALKELICEEIFLNVKRDLRRKEQYFMGWSKRAMPHLFHSAQHIDFTGANAGIILWDRADRKLEFLFCGKFHHFKICFCSKGK